MAIKPYLANPRDPVTVSVNKSSNPTTQLVKTIYEKYGFNSKAYTLIDKIYNKELSIEKAHQIGNTELQYMKELMDISIRKNPRGIHSVEEAQNQLTLKYIRNINDHPSSSHPHLRAISGLMQNSYILLWYWGKKRFFNLPLIIFTCILKTN